MHVVATNIIIWIRTLIKESLHEITESEEEAHKMDAAISVSTFLYAKGDLLQLSS